MAGTNVLVPQGVNELGVWYQPYMHSSARTFNKSRKAYYNNFSLENEIRNAEKIAKKIFTNLIKFYSNYEKEVAAFVGVSPSEMYGDEGFLEKLFAALDSDIKNKKGNFPNLFAVNDVLVKSDQAKKDYIKKHKEKYEKLFKGSWNRGVNKAKKKTGGTGALSKADQQNIDDRAQDAFITTMQIDTDIRKILKDKGLSYPDDVIFAFATSLVTGQIPQGYAQEIKKIRKALEEELKQIESFINQGPSQINPIVITKNSKNYGKVKGKGTLKQHIQNPLHTSVEDVIAYQIGRKGAQAHGKVWNLLMSQKNKDLEVYAEDVGKKQKRTKDESTRQVFVNDVNIVIVNEYGEAKTIGIDIKAYKKEDDKNYKYGRGGIVKQPFELTQGDAIIPFEKLQTFVYLTANSYFYHRQTFDQLLSEPQSGVIGELYEVINRIRGIYGLLPASPIDFSGYNSFQNIGNFVQQDTRVFVVLNDKLMFMTDFLKKLDKQNQVLGKSKQANTVQNLSKSFVDTIKSTFPKKYLTGPLKEAKKQYLQKLEAPVFWEQTPAEALSYYKELHRKFIASEIGSKLLDRWKYRIVTEFIIKDI